jgi:hypothetical protein
VKCFMVGLLVMALCARLPESAVAQRQARFSGWAGPPPAAPLWRPSRVQLPDSLRQKVDYQHWKGAAIGAGVGAVLAACWPSASPASVPIVHRPPGTVPERLSSSPGRVAP